jgi:hypothetical protein
VPGCAPYGSIPTRYPNIRAELFEPMSRLARGLVTARACRLHLRVAADPFKIAISANVTRRVENLL